MREPNPKPTKQSHTELPSLLRERELAERWRLSTRTLQRWRSEHYGPAFILIGGAIRYRMADVLDFEERHRRTGSIEK